jgi:hypothetical protein
MTSSTFSSIFHLQRLTSVFCLLIRFVAACHDTRSVGREEDSRDPVTQVLF